MSKPTHCDACEHACEAPDSKLFEGDHCPRCGALLAGAPLASPEGLIAPDADATTRVRAANAAPSVTAQPSPFELPTAASSDLATTIVGGAIREGRQDRPSGAELWPELPIAVSEDSPSSAETLAEQRGAARRLCHDLLRDDPLFTPLAESVLERLELLGQGGMGTVIKVRDRRVGRLAALKLLSDPQASPGTRERFLREARITACLDHPSIPPVYEAGRTSSGQLFMLMRLIAGTTLATRLKDLHRAKLPRSKGSLAQRDELLAVLVKVGEALAYAHSRGVLHRDVKPSNIMIGAFGEVLLLDWGIAREQGGSAESDEGLGAPLIDPEGAAATVSLGLTLPGTVLGTPGFMPPEQVRGGPLDGRADVFALGVVLAKLLSDRHPIPGDDPLERLVATLKGHIRLPGSSDEALPRELCWITAQALAAEPDRRTASCQRFVGQLKAYLRGAPVPGYRYSVGERALRAARQHPALLITLLLGSMIMTLAGFLQDARREVRDKGEKLEAALIAEQDAQETARETGEQLGEAKRAEARSRRITKLLSEAGNLARRSAPRPEIIRQIEEALTLGERSTSQLLTVAKLYEEIGAKDRARAILREAVERHPPAYEALFYLHLLTVGEDSFIITDAINELRKRGLERGDENKFTLWAAALAAQRDDDHDRAIALYTAIERYSTRFVWAYQNRGMVRARKGDPRGAIADFTKAIELAPRSYKPYDSRGIARTVLGDYKGAIEDHTQAIRLAPDSPKPYVNRGVAPKSLRDVKGAVADYTKAIELDGGRPTAYKNRSAARRALGDHAGAIADCDRAIALDPSYTAAYTERGLARYGLGDDAGAGADFTKALDVDPRSAAAYAARGLAHQRQRDLEPALRDFTKALELEPRDALSYFNRGLLLARLGRKYGDRAYRERAQADLERYLELAPKHPGAPTARAKIAKLGALLGPGASR